MPLTEVLSIEGEEGNFTAQVRTAPRYIDPDKCIACGECARKCPKKVDYAFNAGLNKRRAAYILYDQTVPLKYALDGENCLKITKDKCGVCEKVCPADAIRYDDLPRERELSIGSIILAPGLETLDPTPFDNYGYKRIADVVTSIEYERLMSASGPCQGHVARASDGAEPQRIAWLQCVGSRSVNKCDNPYCSDICCMYALKQAQVTADHAAGQSADQAIFYMDIRTHNKGFEQYSTSALKKGVRLVRARPHSLLPGKGGKGVVVEYVDEAGGEHREDFDMVVLSVGLESPQGATELGRIAGIELDRWGFADSDPFDPVVTSRKGVFVCGGFQEPKDIPRSVAEASAAVCAATSGISQFRGTRATAQDPPPPRDVSGEPPRIGVFVCACGINISSVIDVHAVADYARTLPGVEYVTNNMFTCSQDTQVQLTKAIREHGLNRVVVAACSPRTHEPLFQQSLVQAGLNKYLFTMANIRNHGSWVHALDPVAATNKAKDQVRTAIASARLLTPLDEVTLGVTPSALVLGGGVTGMTAALEIASQGFAVDLVERTEVLGGNARNLRAAIGGPARPYVDALEQRLRATEQITVHTGATVTDMDGFVGNFTTRIERGGAEAEIRHGATILATGAKPLTPEGLYCYGDDPRIMTHLQIDRAILDKTLDPKQLNTAVFIQCVGSREPGRPYCSRVCCTHTVETALYLKEHNPAARIIVLYRDMRSYGQRELLYAQAREAGVIFVRFEVGNKPQVAVQDGAVTVTFTDHILGQQLRVEADLLGLASAMVPGGNKAVSKMLKVPLTEEGWYAEAHAKLRPVDAVTDGVFIAGLAHFPKPLEEAVTQARATVSRATSVLAREHLTLPGIIASIDRAKCVGCGVCWEVCPYGAIDPDEEGFAVVNEAKCKGCGVCSSACRSGAPDLRGFSTADIMAQVSAILG